MSLSITTSLSQISQSVSGNYSTVRQTITASWTYGTYQASGATVKFTCDGTSYSQSTGINTGRSSSGSQSWTHDFTVYHNSDGTKTVSASASLSYWDGTRTASTSKTLTTIPRATTATMSATDLTMGQAYTIDLSGRASSSFTHTLTYAWQSTKTVIATKTTATSVSWTVPLEYAKDIPNSSGAWGTLWVDTYSGDTLIGSTSLRSNVYVPQSMAPTVTASLSSTDTTFGGYASNLSAVKASISATAQYSATISSYSMIVEGTRYTGQTATSNTLTQSGSVTVTVYATDSRGLTGSKEYTISVSAYTVPSLSDFVVHRCTADGTADDSGAYITTSGSGTISAIGSNSGTITVQYRVVGSDTWTSAEVTSSTSGTTVTGSALFAASDTSSYEVQVGLADKAKTVTRTYQISPGYATMDFLKGGKGIALGTTATEEGLEIAMSVFGKGILDYCHPVGSFYWSSESTSPASLFGGTWEQLTNGFIATAGFSYQEWTYECAENESFTLSESTECRFGADGYSYIYKTLAAGTYSAVLATFGSGDPAPNVKKHVDIYKTITIAAGSTGGEAAHTLEAEELAPHGHVEVAYNSYGSGSISGLVSGEKDLLENAAGFRFDLNAIGSTGYFPWTIQTRSLHSRNAGGGKPHNNIPPYVGAYVWKRLS